MTFDRKSVAGRSFLNLLKFYQQKHVKRVNYEAFVWKNALEANQEIPEAHQHGWGVIDETFPMCQCVFQQVLCTDIYKYKGKSSRFIFYI